MAYEAFVRVGEREGGKADGSGMDTYLHYRRAADG